MFIRWRAGRPYAYVVLSVDLADETASVSAPSVIPFTLFARWQTPKVQQFHTLVSRLVEIVWLARAPVFVDHGFVPAHDLRVRFPCKCLCVSAVRCRPRAVACLLLLRIGEFAWNHTEPHISPIHSSSRTFIYLMRPSNAYNAIWQQSEKFDNRVGQGHSANGPSQMHAFSYCTTAKNSPRNRRR